MKVAIDAAGRMVLPKPVRDALGITPGVVLDAAIMDGRLVLEVASPPKRLIRKQGQLVAIADENIPTLTQAEVRAALEQGRR